MEILVIGLTLNGARQIVDRLPKLKEPLNKSRKLRGSLTIEYSMD